MRKYQTNRVKSFFGAISPEILKIISGGIALEGPLPGMKDPHARQLFPVDGLRKGDYFPDCKPEMFVELPVDLGFFAENRLNHVRSHSALFRNKMCRLLSGSRTQGKTTVEGIADLQFEFSSHSDDGLMSLFSNHSSKVIAS